MDEEGEEFVLNTPEIKVRHFFNFKRIMKNLNHLKGYQLTNVQSMKINGGITIDEYREVVAWLRENNPAQLEVVLGMFDRGEIQFEV